MCEHIISIRSPIEEPQASPQGSGPVQSVAFSESTTSQPSPNTEPAVAVAAAAQESIQDKTVSPTEGKDNTQAAAPSGAQRVARKKKASTKGFGLRTKMFFLFLMVPLILFIGSSVFSQLQMVDLAKSITSESTDVVRQMAEDIIVNKAKSVASQCSIFLQNNPDLNKDDFQFDFDMKPIAVQKVGSDGFTALVEVPSPDQDDETGYLIWAHPREAYHGQPLLPQMKSELGLGYRSFQKVFGAMKGGRSIKGYYRTVAEDGSEKEKFMAIEPIEQTPYLIISTTFIEDFTDPIELIEKRASRLTDNTLMITIGFIGGVVIFIGLSIVIYGYRLTSNIQMLTDAADRISVGELDVVIDIRSKDEIGSLADAVTRMQDSLRFSIERLRKRR
ncbi:MAG: HAMP domain-containing protein [Desulfobacterales bacterium]|nr:HAMP domain-containing protein [Desulfobacterales bacterium]